MTYQIDQSIRIEQTNQDTVIGLAATKGNQQYCLIIPAKIKRQLQEHFRRHGLPKRFMINTYTAGVILVLKQSPFKVNTLIIDIEYPGHEIAIINDLQKYFSDNLQVSFSVIGKHSPAHFAAYGVHLGRQKPNHVATLEELLTLINQKDRGF